MQSSRCELLLHIQCCLSVCWSRPRSPTETAQPRSVLFGFGPTNQALCRDPYPPGEGAILGGIPIVAGDRYSQHCSLGGSIDAASGYQSTLAACLYNYAGWLRHVVDSRKANVYSRHLWGMPPTKLTFPPEKNGCQVVCFKSIFGRVGELYITETSRKHSFNGQ